MDGGAWQATVHGVTKREHNWATNIFIFLHINLKYLFKTIVLHLIFQLPKGNFNVTMRFKENILYY